MTDTQGERARTRTLIAALVVPVLAVLLIAPASAQAGPYDYLLAPETTCPGQTDTSLKRSEQVQALLCMYGYARGVSGLPELDSVKKLRKSSRMKAEDLRRCEQLSHRACGRGAFYWFRRVGFFKSRSSGGENLALGSGYAGSARSTMEAWLSSPPHRDLILEPEYGLIGISMVRGKYRDHKDVQYWVAHMGSKRR